MRTLSIAASISAATSWLDSAVARVHLSPRSAAIRIGDVTSVEAEKMAGKSRNRRRNDASKCIAANGLESELF